MVVVIGAGIIIYKFPGVLSLFFWPSGPQACAIATGKGATASVGGGISAASSTSGTAVALTKTAIVVGGLVVGAEFSDDAAISWDCWKAIVHEESTILSKGITVEELSNHENVKKVITDEKEDRIFVFNKFGEKFWLIPVNVPGHGLALHAEKVTCIVLNNDKTLDF